MTDFTVRQLTPKDVDAFTMMAKQFFKETIYGQQFSVDMTKVKDVIRQHSQSDKQVGWLIEIEGQIIGGLLTAAGETFFGRDLVCKEIAVFILPEYRGQGLMSQLVRAYTQWAKTIGARHSQTGYHFWRSH